MTSPVEMTKGRAALPLSVVAEQDPFFIALRGPKAHDSSGRDDKGKGGASGDCGGRTEAVFHHLGWARGPCFPGRYDKEGEYLTRETMIGMWISVEE